MTEILIKKYENRRLYCVTTAKYVSLLEIKELIQDGATIKVIEKSTGNDITKYVMMQVLLEERYELLPKEFYQMVLQSPKNMVDNFFNQFFPWMMEAYKKSKESAMQQKAAMFQNPWLSNMPTQNPFMSNNPFFGGMNKPKEETKEPEGSDKMDEIMKRIRDLEEQLKS